MTQRFLTFVLLLTAAAATASAALAAGPSPGTASAGQGVEDPNRAVRYVAFTGAAETVLAAISTHDGRVFRSRSIVGSYGIPLVTYSGQTGGLSRDGTTLVVSTAPGAGAATQFAIVDARTLRVRTYVTLRGNWSFDALSPDARTMYLIQYLQSRNQLRYRVRAYDLAAGRLVAGAIVDKGEPGAMTGFPVARTESADGAWAYTLYQRGGSAKPFIHALDTVHRIAVCLDLAWTHSQDAVSRARILLAKGGRTLVLRDSVTGKTMLTIAAPA